MAQDYYLRWAAGCCVCCGFDAADAEWENYRTGEITQAETIGEGVRVCGRCVANGHLETADLTEAMLQAIALRNDSPVEDLIASVRP